MPTRKVPLETKHFYHIYFHAIDNLKIFQSFQEKNLFVEIVNYYQNQNTPINFSGLYNRLSASERILTIKKLSEKGDFLVNIISFCGVDNHFHFTLEQLIDNGISLFMKQILSSFSHIYNREKNRRGSLYQSSFCSRLIKTDEDLVHLTAYHHLHPYTNGLVKNYQAIFNYFFSSLPAYFNKKTPIRVNPKRVLEIISPEEYQKYLKNRAQDQKNLEKYKNEEEKYLVGSRI
ncbi:MAG: transposase [Candidatus Shapirobacteria bacterium]|nr:transposase [Candidatus Shapirobacteria bacterium]MDD5481847.1 transposase [Candidatus Shapirobacteria bacterium]